MVKPFDPSKFRKSITKSVKGMSLDFRDPDTWVSTGSYGLNYIISGDFKKGFPLGKVSVLAGESSSGKSYVASANAVRSAQEQGVYVFIIDTENALDEAWLQKLGVDTSIEKMTKISMSNIDDVAKTVSDFIEEYKSDYADIPHEEKPKVLWVIDSISMTTTNSSQARLQNGELSKGDMGIHSKAIKAFVVNTVNAIADINCGILLTNHVYQSQAMFAGGVDQFIVSGGMGATFACSIQIVMQKLKLKEDEDGNKVSKVNGTRAKCTVTKSRYSKPYEAVEIKIPWETGMDPYSGLVDLFELKGLLTKQGNRLKYIDIDTGEEIMMFRKPWNRNENGCLDLVMEQYSRHPLINAVENNEETESENLLDGDTDAPTE